MRLKRFWIMLYLLTLLVASVTSCAPDNQGGEVEEPDDHTKPSFGTCVTYIENENGSVRLTDTVGFAFEFEVILKRDFAELGFEIPVYSDNDSSPITVSTAGSGNLKPKIYVNGVQSSSLPTTAGRYKVRLDISHITSSKYSAGNSLTALGFGEIDLICLY